MLRYLKDLLSTQNQFASGGLLLMIVGALGVYLRSLPLQLWSWLVAQTTMTITVKDDDRAFTWVKDWLLEQRFMKRVRRVDLDTTLRGEELALIPAPGRHWFWHRRRPFWVRFYRSQDSQARTQRRMESLTFQTIGRDRRFLQQFVREVVACHRSRLAIGSFLFVYDDGWSCVEAYIPRSLDSVILQPGEKEHLVADMQKFRASALRYRRIGVPYHRGYLLYGPPGTGKTSLVSGLAAEFGMSIYAMNLNELNDRTLKTAINDVPHNSVILFEDVDCMNMPTRRQQEVVQPARSSSSEAADAKAASSLFGVTLSGLLNVLDGFHAPENVVFVMTTNRIEQLDSALLRPGRIDYKLFMGEAAASQKIELYRRFFPDASESEAEEFVEANAVSTMAEFQGLLLALEQATEQLEHMAMPEEVVA